MRAAGRLALAVTLAVLVAFAGCAAPAAQDPGPAAPGTTESARSSVPETTLEPRTPASGADALPVNAGRVYDRVAAALDSDAERPDVRTVAADELGGGFFARGLTPFHRLLLGVDDAEGTAPAAYYQPDAHRVTVVLHDGVPAGVANAAELRAVLAHEFAHAVTFSDDRYREPMLGLDRGDTTDASRVRLAMVEGAAMYVSDAYSERYLPGYDDGRAMARDYRGEDAFGRYVRGPYRFGGRYFDRRIDAPANLPRVFEDPPATTEQLIHGLAPGGEPPVDLRVRVESTSGENGGSDVRTGRTDTVGELFVRDLLGSRLSESRAARASAGWGNDRVVTVWDRDAADPDRRRFVWALRWDDGRNATQFERTFADYLDARGDRVGDRTWRVAGERFRLDRASDRTVVVVIGESGTVAGVEIAADDGTVSVSV